MSRRTPRCDRRRRCRARGGRRQQTLWAANFVVELAAASRSRFRLKLATGTARGSELLRGDAKKFASVAGAHRPSLRAGRT